MASKSAKCDWNGIKIIFFAAKSQKTQSTIIMYLVTMPRLWYAWVASLGLAQGLNQIIFVQKKTTFG